MVDATSTLIENVWRLVLQVNGAAHFCLPEIKFN